MSQEQSGGIGSTNIQIGSVTTGMTYSDVRDIAKDVFESNFQHLATRAREIAEQRAEELRCEIVSALSNKNVEELAGFQQPEKQLSLFDAQKAYALSGDADLKDTLVNMVVDLSKEPERSMKSVVIQEAIKVIPTLTHQQLLAISAVFLFKYAKFNSISSLYDLSKLLEERLTDAIINLSVTQGDLRHIEYSRCGIVEMGLIEFGHLLSQTYPGLVSSGYEIGELTSSFSDVGIPINSIMPCLNAEGLFQIAALNEDIIETKAAIFSWSPDQIRIAKERLADRLMSPEAIRAKVDEIGGALAALAKLWTDGELEHLKLTSVGIAIAHAQTMASKGDPADLSVWL